MLPSLPKVVHGNFFGSNKWKGSSVVDFILEQSKSPGKKGSKNRYIINQLIKL